MYRILTFFVLFCMLAGVSSYAQTNKPVDIKKATALVQQNAAAMGLKAGSIDNIRVTYAFDDYLSKSTIVYVVQTINGVDVYNAEGTIAFRDGKFLTSNINRVSGLEKSLEKKTVKPSIAAITAIQNVAKDLKLQFTQPVVAAIRQSEDGMEFEFGTGGVSLNNIKARLNWMPSADGAVLAWKVSLLELNENASWNIQVNAISGEVFAKRNNTSYEKTNTTLKPNRAYVYEVPEKFDAPNSAPEGTAVVNSAKYNVIPYPFEDPNFTSPVVVADPWTISANPNAYTNKWHTDGVADYNTTRGNNVRAAEDLDGRDNTAGFAATSTTPLPNLEFLTAPDFNSDPQEEPANQLFGITNLFYWNNMMHDMAYNYGFDEVARNYQATNLGRGGAQNDPVIADALDGSGTDNANFAPTADGSSSRMQMFLWSPSFLKLLSWNAPSSIAGSMPARESDLSDNNKIAQTGTIIDDVVYFVDQDGINHRACDAGNNGPNLQGKIAFIDRGGCFFVNKIRNAQAAGAIAVIVGDSLVGSSRGLVMGGEANDITIPAIAINWFDAEKVRAELDNGVPCNANINSAPRIDGDLDNGVIAHEYTHGISNRLIGTGASCLSTPDAEEQMGEGWSDYFALMMTTNWATANVTDGPLPRPIGNYVAGASPEYGGIRNFPYSTDMTIDPWIYDTIKLSADITELEIVQIAPPLPLRGCESNIRDSSGFIYLFGELWCSTIWDMTWNIIAEKGINRNFFDNTNPEAGGNSIAMNLVMKGMQLTKCNPALVDARDGILDADTLLYGGRYSGAIWTAFARRGLGLGAAPDTRDCKIKEITSSYVTPVLPVIWGKFTAVKQGNSALLKWSTMQEVNADKFIVERSVDGGRTYTAINTVKAKGNSSIESFYQINDLTPAKAKNNYRIKQVDLDGKFSYSDVRVLDFASLKPLIELLPNPVVGNTLTVRIPGNTENLAVQLIGMNGQQLNSYIMSGETLAIDVSRLSSGVYNLVVKGEGYTANYKVVVNK